MANKTTSKSLPETDVILVVKGAGEQTEDEHLNIFLRGFWPAVVSLDKDATIAQVNDQLDGYKPSPHNKDGTSHKHVTEIRASHEGVNRRIWVKESYWEAEVLPSSALGNLSKEWRVASFVFANMFRDIFFTRNSRGLREHRRKARPECEFHPGSTPGTRLRDFIGSYIAYALLFVLVFLPFIVTPNPDTWFKETLRAIVAAVRIPRSDISELTLVMAAAAIWALAPGFELSVGVYKYVKECRSGPFKRLPGLASWILVAMIFLLVDDPIGYVGFVLFLLAWQFAVILARRLLWTRRAFANSDVETAEYYSYQVTSGPNGTTKEKRIGKVDEAWPTRLPLSPLLYRYIIFLTLPIAFVGTILVRILRATRIFSGLADALTGVLNTVLVGYMDDVVNYAMDPAQSHRVVSAVKDDLIYFAQRRDVRRIHVIAHSQGTPITYETLFHFLEPQHQKKIYTYMTIGSVLSYYNQARGVLDEIYYERFPVSPLKAQGFHPDFKWMNFWNFADPITEFYGLDEFGWFEKAPPIDPDFVRSRTSPTNIRTHSYVLDNHGEYWKNFEQVNLPFAKRVLGKLQPEEWEIEFRGKAPNPRGWKAYQHHIGVFFLWLLIAAVAGFGSYWLLTSGTMWFVFEYLGALLDKGRAVFHVYFPPQKSELSGANQRLIADLQRHLMNGTFVVLVIWIAADWLIQFRRAFNIVAAMHQTDVQRS